MKKAIIIASSVLFFILLACKSNDDETPNSPNSGKQITEFIISGESAVINESAKTITLELSGVDLTSLSPEITLSAMATVSPVSGAATDFTNPVTYTVIAEDGTTENYIATVTSAVQTGKQITEFIISGESAVINESAKTITLELRGVDLTSLSPEITLSAMATVSPVSGAATDFTSPVTYTVTAEDGTTENYIATVTSAVQTPTDFISSGLQGPANMVVIGNDLYIANNNSNYLSKVDLSLSSPTAESFISGDIGPFDILSDGNTLICSSPPLRKIHRIDIANPVLETLLTIGQGSFPRGIALDGDFLYVSSTVSNVLEKYDISQANPTPTIIASGLNNPTDMLLHQNYLYIANFGASTVKRLDITVPNAPLEDYINNIVSPSSFAAEGNILYISDYNSGNIYKKDLSDSSAPQLYAEGLTGPYGLVIHEGKLFISEYAANKISKVNH